MMFILSVTEYFKDISTSAKEILKQFVHYDWMQMMMMNGSNGLQEFFWVIAC